MIKYKSYGKMPKKLKGITDSFFNKPVGGLWGCRGEEWKEWCQSEQFRLNRLKNHFYFKLKPHSRILRIKNIKSFIDLCIDYGNTKIQSIDFVKLAEDYDAIEVSPVMINRLRLPLAWAGDKYLRRIIDNYRKNNKYMIIVEGVYAWDVPSICVLNPDVVQLYKN